MTIVNTPENNCKCGHNWIHHHNDVGECSGYSWTGVPCPCLKFDEDKAKSSDSSKGAK